MAGIKHLGVSGYMSGFNVIHHCDAIPGFNMSFQVLSHTLMCMDTSQQDFWDSDVFVFPRTRGY